LSVLSQDKIKKLLLFYFYIFISGIGSVLMFFLIKGSMPINQKEAKAYHQILIKTKQDIFSFDKKILKLRFLTYPSQLEFANYLDVVDLGIDRLRKMPKFLNLEQQKFLIKKLDSQYKLLDYQADLLQKLENSNQQLNKTCNYIPQLKRGLINSNIIFSNNWSAKNQLGSAIDNLLNSSLLYCNSQDVELMVNLEEDINTVDKLLEQQQFSQYKIIVTEFTNYSRNLVEHQNSNDNIFPEIQLEKLVGGLQEVEEYYLEQYYNKIHVIGLYRLLCVTYLFAITVFVAYRIISHLSKTNLNIVKVLEGFTQELETKVEQRTALLEESIQNTESALAQAQNANKAKSTFLANMSHELRTPLNAILGFTQLMCRDASVSEDHQENLKIINRSGEHLLRLINDILEMSKIEVGQITLNETNFDLYTMLSSLEQMLRLKVQAKKIDLVFKINRDVPQFIYTDEGKLRQIIINLLGNALKFTNQGSITLTVKVDKNIVKEDQIDFLFSDTYSLYFSVEDTGPGIHQDEMEKLFTPFEQTEVGRISNEGTGLGLSICYKFAELMGGELKVKSNVGKGSTFFFDILIREKDLTITESVQITNTVENKKIVALAPNQPQYCILAVDDVYASRLLLNKLLSGLGYRVQEASNGQEAIRQWEKWNPDLILMDMRMPIMDGYEATKQIKSRVKDKNTIVIALTASAFEEEKIKILSAGCDDFMRKPFQDSELLIMIGQYLKVEYLYDNLVDSTWKKNLPTSELTTDDLAVMSLKWRSQLYDAASKVDNQEIYQLLQEIPDEYESLFRGLECLVEDFRCDKIIDLAKSAN